MASTGVHTVPNVDELLFDSEILSEMDFTKYACKFSPGMSVIHPGNDLLVRPLNSGDFKRGFLKLLSQIDDVENLDRNDFLRKFAMMRERKNTYYVVVIEDTNRNEVIAAATLIMVQKFAFETGYRGLIRDVVIDNAYDDKQLAKLIVTTVTALAEHLGCYRIFINCGDTAVPLYLHLGFICDHKEGTNGMTLNISQNVIYENEM